MIEASNARVARRRRFIPRPIGALAMACVLAGLVGCMPTAVPGSAPATSDAPVATTTVYRSPSPTPSATTPSAAFDPFKAPQFDPPQTFTSNTNAVTVTPSCSSSTPSPTYGQSTQARVDEHVGTWGAYLGVRIGDRVALIDRVSQTTLWCSPMGLSNNENSTPEIPSSSSVGTPGYEPALNADTLAAAVPISGPYLTVQDKRLWVLQPVKVTRPPIGSQQQRDFFAFVAFDDTGTVRWIASHVDVDKINSNNGSQFLRDPDAGALAVFTKDAEGRDAEGNWFASPGATVTPINVATGAAVATTHVSGTDLQGPTYRQGMLVAGIRGKSSYTVPTDQVLAWNATTGTKIFSSDPISDSSRDWVVAGGVVAVGAGPDANLNCSYSCSYSQLKLYNLATGAATAVSSPGKFDFGTGDPIYAGSNIIVLTGRLSQDVYFIAGIDTTTAKVRWTWKTDDPDPKTGVARDVPQIKGAYHGVIYAQSKAGYYLMSADTGLDLSVKTNIESLDDPYGTIRTNYSGGVTLTVPAS